MSKTITEYRRLQHRSGRYGKGTAVNECPAWGGLETR